MANRTVKDAVYIKGTNPQYLIEKIIRTRIYDCRYWKEECFALTAELLVDKAMELKSLGGTFSGNIKPTPFICLILKMLQIQPEKDIIIEFIRNEDFKYVRALGAIYMRLTANSLDIYKYLEPLYIDYRKMKRMNKNGKYELVHVDEFIDELLHGERVCDIALPRIQKRHVLEESNELEPRLSALDVNLDDLDESSSEEEEEKDESEDEEEEKKDRKRESEREKKRDDRKSEGKSRQRYVDYDNPNPEDDVVRYKRSPSPKKSSRRSRSRSRSRDNERSHRDSERERREREREKEKERERQKEKERRDKEKAREREREKERQREREKEKEKARKEAEEEDAKEIEREKKKKEKKKKSKEKKRSRSRSRSRDRRSD